MILAVDCREFVPERVTGIGRFLQNVLEEIARNRPHLATVAMAGRAATLPVAAPHIAVHRLPARPRLYLDQVVLPQALRQVRAGLFFSPYYKAPLTAPCASVVTIHDLIPVSFPAYTLGRQRGSALAFRAWAALLARRSAAVITDSEYSRGELIRQLGIPRNLVHVFPVGVGEEFRPAARPNDVDAVLARYGIAAPYLLAVGNFLPHKNMAALVEAYATLPEAERRRVRLVLAGIPAGHGPVRPLDLRTLVRPGVITPGFIAPADLPLLYSGATAFACPSLDEGFGLPVLEAMACGTPVVCARAGALPEVAGDAALYVDPENAADIAWALQRMITDPGLQRDLSARGLARVRAFDPRMTTARLVDFLERVAAGPGGR